MRRTFCFLLAFAVTGVAFADDKKQTEVSAKVVVSGKPVGGVFVSVTTGNETKKLRVKLIELSDKTKLAVVMPADATDAPKKNDKDKGVDPDLQRLLDDAVGDAEVAVEGRLSSTTNDVLIATVGGKGAKSVPLLLADRVTDLTAANAKDFPALGSATVEGVLVRNTTKLGKDSTDWAVQNEETKGISMLLSEGAKVPDVGSRVRMTGVIKVVEGRFLVVVRSVDAVK